MPIPAIQASPSPLVLAMEENLHGHIAWVQRATVGMQVVEDEQLLLVDSGLPSETFNKVCRARLKAGDADRRIVEASQYFRDAHRPFAWWIGPGSRPIDLESRLLTHGFRLAESEVGMTMELDRLPTRMHSAADFFVRRVRTPQELTHFASVLAANWNPPDESAISFYQRGHTTLGQENCSMHLFVGYLNDQPVAISEVFLTADIAGLYSVATLKKFRGRGFASLLSWTAANEARRAGASVMSLQASDEAVRLYTRLGFTGYCRFNEYVLA